MAPKAAKKGAAKKTAAAPAPAVDKNWESGLTNAPFDEVSWKACVSLVVGTNPEEEELTRALALAVQQRRRNLFKVLTLESTLAQIHELGDPKGKKPAEVPSFYEVTEAAFAVLDAGKEIPCDLMAKVLKFQLLYIKDIDQQRRESKKTDEERAKAGSITAGKDKGTTKASDKKGKGTTLGGELTKEKQTKLKRRDDTDPPHFTDDEPDDGPQHYVLLLGFHQPQLILALQAIGVHVANVIKLCSECTLTFDGQQSESSEQSPGTLSGSDAEVEEDAGVKRDKREILARNISIFWLGLKTILDSGRPDSKLHEVALLNYTVPDLSHLFHSQDTEAKLDLGIQVFDGVTNVIYDCLDWRRQYEHYLDSIKFIRIPTVGGSDPQQAEAAAPAAVSKQKAAREQSPSSRETLCPAVDMSHYGDLLDLVPPEVCSVPLILHCLLEQVVISTGQPSSSTSTRVTKEEVKRHQGPGLNHELISFMLQSFLPLAHEKEEKEQMINGLLTTAQSEEDRKKLVERFGAEENRQKCEQPLVIRHHNERALRLRNINAAQRLDPAEVEVSMMKLSPVWKLIHSGDEQKQSRSSWVVIKQQLQHYCADDDVPWKEVERFFHQSVFESMPLTQLDPAGALQSCPDPLGSAQQHSPAVLPWDNPLSYAKQQLKKLQTSGPTFVTEGSGTAQQAGGRVYSQLDFPDLQSYRLTSLLDWHYAEHHDASIFPQVLQSATEEYCCLDLFRGSHNDVLYIFCHNPMTPSRQCREVWAAALYTDIKFRTYLDFVATTISDWTKEEELKREEMELRLSSAGSAKDEKAPVSAWNNDPLEPVIRKDSLKIQRLEEERLKEEEMAKRAKKDSGKKGSPQVEAPQPDKKKSKGAKGDKNKVETASKAPSSPIESQAVTPPPVAESEELQPTEEPRAVFTGYRTDGMLIHVSGCRRHLFPSDGGQINVEKVCYAEGSSLTKVAVEKDGHCFYTHINTFVFDLPKPQDKETNVKKEEAFKVLEPVKTRGVRQGFLTAVLHNGIHLAYSSYGPTGEHIVSHQRSEIQLNQNDEDSPDVKDNHSKPPDTQSAECEVQPEPPSSPFNSLSLSLPNGLLLQFLREDAQGVSSDEQRMLVRQSFPLHGRGAGGQDAALVKELSRIVTSEGAVIRNMRDGSTEVLFADGSVSYSQDSGPVWVPDSEVLEENAFQETDVKVKEKEGGSQRGCWVTTTPSGECICTVGTTHQVIPKARLQVYKATDPITREVMLIREDQVVSVQNGERSVIVEHADGTRITRLLQERRHRAEHLWSAALGSSPGCVPRCAGTINGSTQDQHTFDSGDEISRNGACDKDAAGHANMSESEHVSGETVSPTGEDDDEEGVWVAENDKRSEGESDVGSVSNKERVILVEKEGCATVVIYTEGRTAHVFLADGTVVTGNVQGAYQVFPSNTGQLQIQSDGTSVYVSDPLVTPTPTGSTPTNQLGSYTMSHTDEVACDVTDHDGNRFQVMEDGLLSVTNLSPVPGPDNRDEEESEEEADLEVDRINRKPSEHYPRLFLAYVDGSGTELLRSHTVEEVLNQAYSDPTIAVLKEPLPDTRGDFGITILKPSHENVWSQWLLQKQVPDITPPNLRNRSWHDFPTVEKKSPGPPFGTDMGQGLTLTDSSGGFTTQLQPVRSCPKVLEIRELHQHRPLTRRLRNTVDQRLKEYIESLMEQEQQSEDIIVKDPRTDKESARASHLLHLVLSFAEEADSGHAFGKRTSEDIVSLYSRRVEFPVEQPVPEDPTTEPTDRQEMYEEQAHRQALRKRSVVPYFHPENISLYQSLLQHPTPDMWALSMDLPPTPKSARAEASLRDAPQQDSPPPLNLTPSQSASHVARRRRKLEKGMMSLTPPSTALFPARLTSDGFKSGESLRGSTGHCKLVQLDVTGKPRRTKVRLPTCILSSKPGSVPNQQFLSVEEPVRRKCRTISLNKPNVVLRGFQLLPATVDFGTLEEGNCSTITVRMRNVGVDTCRFHVKQPPPATGLRVLYLPGPVAAGLHVDLQVQLFALCAVQAGPTELKTFITQDIIIHTEMEILYLPVTATIIPQRLYDMWFSDQTSSPNKKGSKVRQLSSSLPGI